ncbi:MAG: hypothetical protein HOV79_09660 [Hamadaea sp.]|nr:hypothetical protein [Hamadaea sp.]
MTVSLLPRGVRAAALTSGVVGFVADVFLVLYYAVAKPWQENPAESWFGTANDVLIIVQFGLLAVVVLGLARAVGAPRVRPWSIAAALACAVVVLLQALFVAGVFTFGAVVVPVSLGCIVTMIWAAVVSRPARAAGVISATAAALGRALGILLPAALAVFAIGFAVTAAADISWAWVAGAAPAFALWFVLPLWTAAVALPARSAALAVDHELRVPAGGVSHPQSP